MSDEVKVMIQIVVTLLLILFPLIYYLARPEKHTTISLIGPTSSGKTTLLNTLQNSQHKYAKTLKLTKYEFQAKTIFDTPSCLKQKYEMDLQKNIIFLFDTKMKKIYFKVDVEKDYYLELILQQILKKAKITLLFNNLDETDLDLVIQNLKKLLEAFIKESRVDLDDELKVDYSQEFFERDVLGEIKQKYAIDSRVKSTFELIFK